MKFMLNENQTQNYIKDFQETINKVLRKRFFEIYC